MSNQGYANSEQPISDFATSAGKKIYESEIKDLSKIMRSSAPPIVRWTGRQAWVTCYFGLNQFNHTSSVSEDEAP